ncbi:hypothetical protein RHGRI_021088 [Rhododendron griersonianum]|uniref:HBS1-like protein n=1 Tax=Rhododendron griersonianum TaxID=479676 RepID=A0AAV6JR34_9ERIC|nr:hypothetical protein RHGRI_021088 [Rhododendron griersonianum]
MPRKVNYGVDYDEDDYDDGYEDYDYDYDVQENFEEPETKQETTRPGVWHCPICTFDNEDSMSSCDICGVLRNPLVNTRSGIKNNTVDGMSKYSGASIMAKSLFESWQHSTPNKTLTLLQLTDEFVMVECNSSSPFKFDAPSPDDLVSKGLRLSKAVLRANNNKLSSSDVTSSVTEKKTAVGLPSNGKRFASSSALMSEDSYSSVGENASSPSNKVQQQSLSTSLNNISLNVKPGSSKNVNAGRAISNAHYKPEKWMLPEPVEDRLTQLNLAIVGHVDSGKSTLSGRLLQLSGRISQKEMHKYEKEAKLQGKGSFAYAWALDESAEERERGITMTVAVAYFDSKRYHVVLLDSPGHKDFVPNMISGAAQADAAILVIDASVGSFEAGMDSTGGQTREHAQLIRSFGADQIIVAINKMDVVEYSKERFDAIKLQVGTFLRSCGFKDSSVSWVPLSAIENQKLVVAASDSRLLSWYKGPSLFGAIDSLRPPARDYSKPLVMPICDVIKLPPQGLVSACGKLEAGALRNGSKVLVMPSGDIGTVRSLERDSQSCTIARAGDNVAVCLLGTDASQVMAGEFHIHHAREAARVVKILSLLDSRTGKVTKKAPRCLLAKQSAVVEVALQEAVCVEEFSTCKALGRVFLRALGRTIAVGVVTRIIEELRE